MKTVNQVFAENLSEELRRQNITKAAFAKRIGVSQQAISSYTQTGEKAGAMPRYDVLVKIADTLKVSIDSLFGRKIQETEKNELPKSAIKQKWQAFRSLVKSVEVLNADKIGQVQLYGEHFIAICFSQTDNYCISQAIEKWGKIYEMHNENNLINDYYDLIIDKIANEFEEAERNMDEHGAPF